MATPVVRLSLRAKTLASIRLGVGALGLVACLLAAETPGPPVLAGAVGAVLIAILILGDPRRRSPADAEPLPPDAVPETWQRIARTDVFPSTVAVAILMWIVLAYDPVLAAFLAGILIGMGLLSMVALIQVAVVERRQGRTLYAERGGTRRFEAN